MTTLEPLCGARTTTSSGMHLTCSRAAEHDGKHVAANRSITLHWDDPVPQDRSGPRPLAERFVAGPQRL